MTVEELALSPILASLEGGLLLRGGHAVEFPSLTFEWSIFHSRISYMRSSISKVHISVHITSKAHDALKEKLEHRVPSRNMFQAEGMASQGCNRSRNTDAR
ncbi:hypothetical protein V6Z12_D13G000200 [Gossypium hirsutum]